MTDNTREDSSQVRPDERRPKGQWDGTVSTNELFEGREEVLIHHGKETYRLRITRAGKLILHK